MMSVKFEKAVRQLNKVKLSKPNYRIGDISGAKIVTKSFKGH